MRGLGENSAACRNQSPGCCQISLTFPPPYARLSRRTVCLLFTCHPDLRPWPTARAYSTTVHGRCVINRLKNSKMPMQPSTLSPRPSITALTYCTSGGKPVEGQSAECDLVSPGTRFRHQRAGPRWAASKLATLNCHEWTRWKRRYVPSLADVGYIDLCHAVLNGARPPFTCRL